MFKPEWGWVFSVSFPELRHPLNQECEVAWEGRGYLCWFLSTEKKPNSLAWSTGCFWSGSIRLYPVHPLSFQLLVRNRPFQWLYAPVQAVFSAWNAFLWPPYLAWSRWYFTPFCFPLERDWPSFGPQLRQVYLWHTLWVIFLPLASCVFFFLCLFLTLIFNSLQFSLLLVFHVQHYIWKALLCLFGYITGDKEICLWLPA